jgi:D-xylose transport system permease protein
MATTEPAATEVEAEDAPAPEIATSNEYVANSFGEYARGQWQRIRGGDAGVLPVVIGFVIIVIVFQAENSRFLSSGNLVNLFQQASIYMVFGIAEIFILLLGEIDLSIGFNAGVGATIIAELSAPPDNHSWIVATLAGVAVCGVIGFVQGVLITRFDMPSFIVTLGGYLGLQGVILWLFDADKHATGGSIQIFNGVINGIMANSLSPTVGWIVMIVAVAVIGALMIGGALRRRMTGLSAPPIAVTAVKVALLAAAGVVVVWICNQNRSVSLLPNAPKLEGVPYVVLVVLAIAVLYTFMMDRTRFGRYVYAIGGNPEAARRAGVRVKSIRTVCFVLAGITGGIAGLLLDSFQGGASSSIQGGVYVLYAVAAAVIGGTSLFGGRGRIMHGLLGGLVIAGIYNGMILLGLSAAGQYMINALVLLAAVLIDSLARRGKAVR